MKQDFNFHLELLRLRNHIGVSEMELARIIGVEHPWTVLNIIQQNKGQTQPKYFDGVKIVRFATETFPRGLDVMPRYEQQELIIK